MPAPTMLGDHTSYVTLDAPAVAGAPTTRSAHKRGLRTLVSLCAPVCLALVGGLLYVWLCLIPSRLADEARHSVADTSTDGLFVIAIGDWGGVPFYPYVTPAQLAVRDEMSKAASASSAPRKLVLALGDNFYQSGVLSDEDARFKSTFEEVYVNGHPELSAEGMWRVVAGNHDYMALRDVSAQIAYSNRSSTWRFPSEYYTFAEHIQGDGGAMLVAQFVMIDTVLLSVGHDGILNGEPARARSAAHWRWLSETLAASTADYLVVAGHYPVWSVCSHGPTRVLVERLRPLLLAHKASAYFFGHDHCAQALVEGGVHHHGVGGAHLLGYGTQSMGDVPHGSLAFHFGAAVWPANLFKGAFATASFGQSAMTVTHFDSDGRPLHSLRQPPRQ